MRQRWQNALSWGCALVSMILMLVRVVLVPTEKDLWGLDPVTNSTRHSPTEVTTAIGSLAIFAALYTISTSVCEQYSHDALPVTVMWINGGLSRSGINAWVAITGTDIALLLAGQDVGWLVGLDACIVFAYNLFLSAEDEFMSVTIYDDDLTTVLGTEMVSNPTGNAKQGSSV